MLNKKQIEQLSKMVTTSNGETKNELEKMLSNAKTEYAKQHDRDVRYWTKQQLLNAKAVKAKAKK